MFVANYEERQNVRRLEAHISANASTALKKIFNCCMMVYIGYNDMKCFEYRLVSNETNKILRNLTRYCCEEFSMISHPL